MHPTPTHQPAGWPFPPLTPAQAQAHAEQLEALRAGALRGLPSAFGALDDGDAGSEAQP